MCRRVLRAARGHGPRNPEERDWLADERARWDREHCRMKRMMAQGLDKQIAATSACLTYAPIIESWNARQAGRREDAALNT